MKLISDLTTATQPLLNLLGVSLVRSSASDALAIPNTHLSTQFISSSLLHFNRCYRRRSSSCNYTQLYSSNDSTENKNG